SSKTTLTAGNAVGSGVTIKVGSTTENVTSKTALTPAEFVAAIQVATTGRQQIVLSGSAQSFGVASGGSLSLNSFNINGLNVPSGVTAVDDFAKGSTLNLTNNLLNAGTFYAVSSSAKVTTASITAASITNTGLLTSVLPAGGLPGYS